MSLSYITKVQALEPSDRELDPNLFDINANEMRIMAYQYRTGVPGNIKLDSVEIVFVKQLNRK